MILDKDKIQHRMIDNGIYSFVKLAENADVSQTTLFQAMDTNRWQARTVEKLATELKCSPLDLITVEEVGGVTR